MLACCCTAGIPAATPAAVLGSIALLLTHIACLLDDLVYQHILSSKALCPVQTANTSATGCKG